MPATILHLVGPGGSGKTTVGTLLGHSLGWRFIDLDEYFLQKEGDIASMIQTHSYETYAMRNVQLYKELIQPLHEPAVIALSSGFMTYPQDISPDYPRLRESIETDPLTVLLLPSFSLEACTSTIVERQLSRTYLHANRQRETQKIRQRFPLFLALRCKRFLSNTAPMQIASEIEQFVRQM